MYSVSFTSIGNVSVDCLERTLEADNRYSYHYIDRLKDFVV